MMELAVAERYIFGQLKGMNPNGWVLPQIAPFQAGDAIDGEIRVPILYFRMVGAGDVNAMGPGPRLLSWADYEIGIFHDYNSFGAMFDEVGGGTISLLEILQSIDDIFQNYTPPIVDATLGGTIYSTERKYAVRVEERSGGRLYRRDGGVYRFFVEAD